MPGYQDSGWGDATYDKEYRDNSEVFIQERVTLLHIVSSFFQTFVAAGNRADGEQQELVRILDLGCGDGILAETLCRQAYPKAGRLDVTVSDGSAEMLSAAHERLAQYPVSEFCQITFEQIIEGEFRRSPFDLIVSSFAIHHLRSKQKLALFQRLFDLLVPGAFFLNIDVVLSDTEAYTEWYFALWRQWIAARQERFALAEDFTSLPEQARAKDENHFEPLSLQMEALALAGFQSVTCHYRYGLFAIYGGQRPG